MTHTKFLAGIIGIMLVFGNVTVNAQDVAGSGGFTGSGSGSTLTTVSEAKNLSNHSPVLLRGNIIRLLDNKRVKQELLFRDNTGEVVLEIEYRVWNGLYINENDTVEIFGYVDRNSRLGFKDIDVQTIKKL
jgi:uncharacterized protein (TIGR00156 family)